MDSRYSNILATTRRLPMILNQLKNLAKYDAPSIFNYRSSIIIMKNAATRVETLVKSDSPTSYIVRNSVCEK